VLGFVGYAAALRAIAFHAETPIGAPPPELVPPSTAGVVLFHLSASVALALPVLFGWLAAAVFERRAGIGRGSLRRRVRWTSLFLAASALGVAARSLMLRSRFRAVAAAETGDRTLRLEDYNPWWWGITAAILAVVAVMVARRMAAVRRLRANG
jgi:hypothetical protein